MHMLVEYLHWLEKLGATLTKLLAEQQLEQTFRNLKWPKLITLCQIFLNFVFLFGLIGCIGGICQAPLSRSMVSADFISSFDQAAVPAPIGNMPTTLPKSVIAFILLTSSCDFFIYLVLLQKSYRCAYEKVFTCLGSGNVLLENYLWICLVFIISGTLLIFLPLSFVLDPQGIYISQVIIRLCMFAVIVPTISCLSAGIPALISTNRMISNANKLSISCRSQQEMIRKILDN